MSRLPVVLSLLGLLLTGVAGCADRPNTTQDAAIGAAGGALVGGVIGHNAGGRHGTEKGALIGAAAGAIAGGVIGNQADSVKFCPLDGRSYPESYTNCPYDGTALQYRR